MGPALGGFGFGLGLGFGFGFGGGFGFGFDFVVFRFAGFGTAPPPGVTGPPSPSGSAPPVLASEAAGCKSAPTSRRTMRRADQARYITRVSAPDAPPSSGERSLA